MKKIILLLLAINGIAFGQEKIICSVGNETNGFGILENESKTIIEAGFRTDGLLNGTTFMKENNGHYIFSNFKNGIPTGNSVYYIGEGSRQHGVYENGMKEGIHVLVNDLNLDYTVLITYKNDKEVSREKFKLDFNAISKDCQGDCENGYGAKIADDGLIYIGFFKNSEFYRGEILNNERGSCTIYNLEDKGLEKGVYALYTTNSGLIEIFRVLFHIESLNHNVNRNSMSIIREKHKITGTNYNSNGEETSTLQNF
jgi:hypothetical protein